MTVQYIDGKIEPIPCKCKNCTAFEHCMGGRAILEAELLRKEMTDTDGDQGDADDIEKSPGDGVCPDVAFGRPENRSVFVAGYAALKRLIGKFAEPDKEKAE